MGEDAVEQAIQEMLAEVRVKLAVADGIKAMLEKLLTALAKEEDAES